MKKFVFIITVILLSATLYRTACAQSLVDAMRAEAVKEMQFGRYGEAIDVLNRYISARPQNADGYNFRGICYEKRKQFEMAVYDFRSAKKLAPENKEINDNLNRATSSWYSILYNEIEGHKREIAINPKNAESYLAVGKDYKNLGQWSVAEEWYDKYLTMVHASSDEIIRYTEILAKNNHLAKGWPVLKKYTEEYPNDQRLWSRFGYFSLWLGKNKVAVSAFQSALAIKPYFKEAMDGLDLAKGKGYVFTVNDTTQKRFNYGMAPSAQAFIYPIDKYYGILKKTPQDNETRMKLLNALIEAKRYEEARQQVLALEFAKYDSVTVYNISSRLDSISTAYYQEKINEMMAKFKPDSTDKNTALSLGLYYSRLQNYDSAMVAYDAFLNKHPQDEDVLFAYAQAYASNRDYNRALEKMDLLLKMKPGNLKYKLFVGQLDVWLGQNLDTAKLFLEEVLKHEPNNLAALIAYSSLNMRQNNFTVAKDYIEKVRALGPGSADLKSLETTFETQKLRYQQEQYLVILQEGRRLWGNGQCTDALAKYEEYMSKSEPNILVEKEYADVNVCAHNYQKAIAIYDSILSQGYDYNTDLSKAETFYQMGDSVNSVKAFQTLVNSNPEDFTANLYLGDSYIKMREYKQAAKVYDRMQDSLKLDSTQTAMVQMRYKWMPVTGFKGFINSFPMYASLTPTASIYGDNIGIRNYIQGLRLDLGITSFLTIGAEGFRTLLTYGETQISSLTYRWDLTFRFADRIVFMLDFGNNNYNNYYSSTYVQPVAEVVLRTEDPSHYMAYIDFTRQDMSQVIYSSYLITNRLRADLTRAGGYFQLKSGLKLTIDGTYYSFSDGNTGYNLSGRIGKYFYPDFMLGYEYYTSGFQNTSSNYFSPSTYSINNLFADWDIVKESDITVTIGGLLGFVANSSAILKQGYATVTWKPFDRFTITGRLAGGSSFQNTWGYRSSSALLTAYWTL